MLLIVAMGGGGCAFPAKTFVLGFRLLVFVVVDGGLHGTMFVHSTIANIKPQKEQPIGRQINSVWMLAVISGIAWLFLGSVQSVVLQLSKHSNIKCSGVARTKLLLKQKIGFG
jgi:hypothetical protein